MKTGIFLCLWTLAFIFRGVAQTAPIEITVNLKQTEHSSCPVRVCLPFPSVEGMSYCFAAAVPGCYEIQNFGQYISRPSARTDGDELLPLKKQNNTVIFPRENISVFTYSCRQSAPAQALENPEDCLFTDSVFLLNWHSIAGFILGRTLPYRITVIKPKGLYGSTSLTKKSVDDTTDHYFASSYEELIHGPVLYAQPDTTRFRIGNTEFAISTSTPNARLHADSLKKILLPMLEFCLSRSVYRPEKYNFIYLTGHNFSNGLSALEHPFSSVVSFPLALSGEKSSHISAIHEFCHTLYAPLYLTHSSIEPFDFQSPVCDEHLWFYEGVTEYIARKTAFQTGYTDTTSFLRSLWLSEKNTTPENMARISRDIYKSPDNLSLFYQQGYYTAFLLDWELCRRSEGQLSLRQLLGRLQSDRQKNGIYTGPSFYDYLSLQSGLDLSDFFNTYITSVPQTDLTGIFRQTGFQPVVRTVERSHYTFGPMDFTLRNDPVTRRQYLEIRKSLLNRQSGIPKLNIYKINGRPVDMTLLLTLRFPDGNPVRLTHTGKGQEKEITVTPLQNKLETTEISFTPLPVLYENAAAHFWAY